MDDISLTQEARRGTLRFRLAPGMNIYLRLLLFVILTTAGASVIFRFFWAYGLPVYLMGLWMIMARGVSNARKTPDTSNDRWVVGSAMDLRKIERKVRQSENLPSSALDGMTGWGFLLFLTSGIGCFVVDITLVPESIMMTSPGFWIAFIQATLLITVFYTTMAGTWEPENIIKKRELFVRARDRILDKWKNLQPVVRPMLLLDEGDKDNVTPEDIKLFITFEDAPESFIGVQAQITFNMGQPYLYCVILAKNDFAPIKKFTPKAASKITCERGADKDVLFLVARQTTTRDSGYSTSGEEADHVVDTAMRMAGDILGR
jgi:hypothetical protein